MRGWRAISLLMLALALGAKTAIAQLPDQLPYGGEPSASEIALARKLFAEATALEKERKFAEAEEKLRAALAIKDTSGVRYHLAFCLERQGKLAAARREYRTAQYQFEQGQTAPGIAELLGPAIEKIEARVPQLRLDYDKDASVRVEVDGETVTVLGPRDPIWVDPGTHTVVVRRAHPKPSTMAFTRTVTVKEGEHLMVAVSWPEEPAAPPASIASKPEPAREAQLRELPFGFESETQMAVVISASALALLGTGMGIWQATEAESMEYDRDKLGYELEQESGMPNQACLDPPPERAGRCARLRDLNDDLGRERTLAWVSFGASGVFAVGAVAAYLFWPESNVRTASARLSVAPAREGMQWTLSGRF